MRILKKTILGICVFTAAAALFVLSCGICAAADAAASPAVQLSCVLAFIACAGVMVLIFIIDREKPLVFAWLYAAAVLAAAVLFFFQTVIFS